MLVNLLKTLFLFFILVLFFTGEVYFKENRVHIKVELRSFQEKLNGGGGLLSLLSNYYLGKMNSESKETEGWKDVQVPEICHLGVSDNLYYSSFLSGIRKPSEPDVEEFPKPKPFDHESTYDRSHSAILDVNKETTNPPTTGVLDDDDDDNDEAITESGCAAAWSNETCKYNRPNIKILLMGFIDDYVKQKHNTDKGLVQNVSVKAKPPPTYHLQSTVSFIVSPALNKSSLHELLPIVTQVLVYSTNVNPLEQDALENCKSVLTESSYFKNWRKIEWLRYKLN